MPSILQAISSFFSGSNSRESSGISTAPSSRGRRTVMSPTTKAFSLPTHSPILSDADSPSNIATASSSSAFSYPPTNNAYDYDYALPSAPNTGLQSAISPSAMRPPQTRQNSNSPILPLHHDPSSNGLPVSPLQSSPPLHHTWNRLRNWLSSEYTELGDTLNYGIDPAVITAVQMELGLPLPSAVRDSYLMCDGQEVESSAGCPDGLFFGLTLLPLEDVLEEWRFWREVDEDPATGANTRLRSVMKSIPDGYVRKEYSCRGWLPLVTDRAGNYLGVDLHPGEQGTYGQVIVFGRDFDTKVVMWRGEGEGGWGRWLASFVDDLENGEGYELGATNDASSDSEDDVGYEGYFYSNGVGRDGGEGNTGGLRLTGEYKGWNVLEAWADRSVKRWMQAGVYKGDLDPAPRPDTEVSDVAAVTNSGPATEVAIPALQTGGLASGRSDPPPATADITDPNNGETPATPRVPVSTLSPPQIKPPTISVTVPPVPQPVLLPTPQDLLTSAPPSPSSSNATAVTNDAPKLDDPLTAQFSGKIRIASEGSNVSDVSMDSQHAAELPLVADSADASLTPVPSQSSMADISLIAATPRLSSTDDLPPGKPLSPPIIPVQVNSPRSPITSSSINSDTIPPTTDGLEQKTPTSQDFSTSSSGGQDETDPLSAKPLVADPESDRLANGTNGITLSSPPSTPTAIPPSSTSASTSSPPTSSPPTVSDADPSRGATSSRPSTPTSVTSAGTKRLQKVAHKKSARSISQLFERKEKESGASSVKEDDEKEKDRSSKRGSMFGTPFKSLVSTKTKDKEKKTGGSDAMV